MNDLQKTCQEYLDIFENIPDGLFMIDQNGTVLHVNKSYEAILGESRKNILGRPIKDLSSLTQLPVIGQLVLESKKAITIDQVMLRTNKTVLVSGTPILDTKGNVKNVIGIVRDISVLASLRQKLNDIEYDNEKYLVALNHLRNELDDKERVTLIAQDPRMQEVLNLVERIAVIEETILITGETGTGKEEIARKIYSQSRRSHMPFIKVNCGAIPENLIESELFGYEHGAFTGARKGGHPGLFEAADKGTLFLDEIGELPLNLQVKLLRVIQEQEITRIGGTKPIKVNVRLICATNRDLREMVKANLFREDLYYRLNVIPLHLPPLRDRKKDIRPLADFFLRRICSKYDMKKCFDEDAYNVFLSYPWPGNIRELRNIVERTAIMSQHPVISEGRVRRELHHYSSTGYDTSMKETIASSESDTTNTITADTLQYTPDFSSSVNLKEIIESIEARYIINAYDSCQSIRKAARLLSMDPATYLRKYRKYTDS